MISQIMSVRDSKTEVFSQPMFFVTKGVALRAFMDEVQRAGSDVSKHPEDFSFWHLGSFDDTTGDFIPLAAPDRIALAIDCKTE